MHLELWLPRRKKKRFFFFKWRGTSCPERGTPRWWRKRHIVHFSPIPILHFTNDTIWIFVLCGDQHSDHCFIWHIVFPTENNRHPVSCVFVAVWNHQTWKMSTMTFSNLCCLVWFKLAGSFPPLLQFVWAAIILSLVPSKFLSCCGCRWVISTVASS